MTLKLIPRKLLEKSEIFVVNSKGKKMRKGAPLFSRRQRRVMREGNVFGERAPYITYTRDAPLPGQGSAAAETQTIMRRLGPNIDVEQDITAEEYNDLTQDEQDLYWDPGIVGEDVRYMPPEKVTDERVGLIMARDLGLAREYYKDRERLRNDRPGTYDRWERFYSKPEFEERQFMPGEDRNVKEIKAYLQDQQRTKIKRQLNAAKAREKMVRNKLAAEKAKHAPPQGKALPQKKKKFVVENSKRTAAKRDRSPSPKVVGGEDDPSFYVEEVGQEKKKQKREHPKQDKLKVAKKGEVKEMRKPLYEDYRKKFKSDKSYNKAKKGVQKKVVNKAADRTTPKSKKTLHYKPPGKDNKKVTFEPNTNKWKKKPKTAKQLERGFDKRLTNKKTLDKRVISRSAAGARSGKKGQKNRTVVLPVRKVPAKKPSKKTKKKK